jgi:hypothetical protein
MTEKRATVTVPIVRELASAGAIESVVVRMDEDESGLVGYPHGCWGADFSAARTGVRYFQSVDGAISALQVCGLSKFEVDANGWVPRTKQGKQTELDI